LVLGGFDALQGAAQILPKEIANTSLEKHSRYAVIPAQAGHHFKLRAIDGFVD
jgi:hypothetical protein